MARQVNLPVCSPRCSFNAQLQAGKVWIPVLKVIGLTRLVIKSERAAPDVDAYPLGHLRYFLLLKIYRINEAYFLILSFLFN